VRDRGSAGEDGSLVIDPNGRLLSEYAVKVGRTEFNTKCSYDAVQVLEHLISHADDLQVDLRKCTSNLLLLAD